MNTLEANTRIGITITAAISSGLSMTATVFGRELVVESKHGDEVYAKVNRRLPFAVPADLERLGPVGRDTLSAVICEAFESCGSMIRDTALDQKLDS